MKSAKAQFPAKILLFGEYTILRGSSALAIPCTGFSAEWAMGAPNTPSHLMKFADYLAGHFKEGELDVVRFKADLHTGLYLRSDMPIGYGIGSSGALCAAVLERYGSEKTKTQQAQALQSFFAKMESFFHGSSSGMDPLVCYLRQALRLNSDAEYIAVKLPVLQEFQLFLLDTGQARETGPLVEFFKKRYEDKTFREGVEKKWIPATEKAIQHYLAGTEQSLWEAFSNISEYQRQALPPMIPAHIRDIWDQGLAANTYRLKICGAGGGGFMLGITQKGVDLPRLFADFNTIEIN